MKALSLWQPWASLIAAGWKIHETRHWPTNHRGPLAIQAAQRPLDDETREAFLAIRHVALAYLGPPAWSYFTKPLPRGAVVAVATLADCIPTEQWLEAAEFRPGEAAGPAELDFVCGDFSPERWAWRLADVRPLPAPLPWRGAQGLFEIPDATIAAALGGELPPPPATAQGTMDL